MRTANSVAPGFPTSDSRPKSGLTLVEMLVAFMLFVALVGLLVTLVSSGLEAWDRGEFEKDNTERLQAVLGTIEDDISNMYLDFDYKTLDAGSGPTEQFPAAFTMRTEKDGTRVLAFVRRKGEDLQRYVCKKCKQFFSKGGEHCNIPLSPVGVPSGNTYENLVEVAYVSNGSGVYRLTNPFANTTLGAGKKRSLLSTLDPKLLTPDALLNRGILYMDFKCNYIRDTKPDSSEIWDSTRGKLIDGKVPLKKILPGTLDQALPQSIEFTVVVETIIEGKKKTLVAPVSSSERNIKVSSGAMAATAPGYMKIGNELIEYKSFAGDTFIVSKRGALGTKEADHKFGDEVHLGYTYTISIPFPLYRNNLQ